jgi:hypothetical protein
MVALFVRYPKIAGLVGLVCALLFGNLAIFSYHETQRLPSTPIPVSVAEAAVLAPTGYDDRPWIEITDGVFDCESLRYKSVGGDNRTQIIVTDQARTIAIIAEYSTELTCQQVSENNATGLLSRMNERRYNRFLELNEFDLTGYEKTEVFMDLCAFCGRRNSQLLAVVGGILVVLSLSLYPICLAAHRKKVRAGGFGGVKKKGSGSA